MRALRLIPAVCLLVLATGCGPRVSSDAPPSMVWTDVTSTYDLPDGIEVFAGVDEVAPLRAWLARVDASRPGIDIQVVASDDDDGRESVSDMVQETNACLGVNGGYFLQTESSFEHIGLLIANGSFEHPATPGLYANDARYPVRRSAIGLDRDDEARIGWVSSRQDSSFWWDEPIPNAPDAPYMASDEASAEESGPDEADTEEADTNEKGPEEADSTRKEGAFWPASDAIAAGPMILRDGRVDVASDEEVFFHTTIPDVHPRTAAALDADGRILLLVVDGRQSASRGVSLEELGALLLEFDAMDALNLDGGGSSTFIVGDELLNRPAGATYQREVVSGIIVRCR